MGVTAATEHYRPGALRGAARGFGLQLRRNPIPVPSFGKQPAVNLQSQFFARGPLPLRPRPLAGSVQLQLTAPSL